MHSAAPLRDAPDARGSWTTEALFGELVTVYEERDGWAWVQLAARRLRRLPAPIGAVRAGQAARRTGCRRSARSSTRRPTSKPARGCSSA